MISEKLLLSSLAKQMKYYVEVKRLEDGFDLSGSRDSHQAQKGSFTVGYAGIHDSQYKHLVRCDLDHVQRTDQTMHDRRSDNASRQKEIKKRIQRQMDNYEFLNTPVLSMYYLSDGRSRNGKLLSRRSTVAKGTGFVVQKTPKSNLYSVPQTARILNNASRLIVAAESVSQNAEESDEDSETNYQEENNRTVRRRNKMHKHKRRSEPSRASGRNSDLRQRDQSPEHGEESYEEGRGSEEESAVRRNSSQLRASESSSVLSHGSFASRSTIEERSLTTEKQPSEPKSNSNRIARSGNNSALSSRRSQVSSASSTRSRNHSGSRASGATTESETSSRGQSSSASTRRPQSSPSRGRTTKQISGKDSTRKRIEEGRPSPTTQHDPVDGRDVTTRRQRRRNNDYQENDLVVNDEVEVSLVSEHISTRNEREGSKSEIADDEYDVGRHDNEPMNHRHRFDSDDLVLDDSEADNGSRREGSKANSNVIDDGDSATEEDDPPEKPQRIALRFERDNSNADLLRSFDDEFFDHPVKRDSDVHLVHSPHETLHVTGDASWVGSSGTNLMQGIHNAARTGDFVSFVELVEDEPGLISYRDNDGMMPLHLAAMNNQVEIIKFLCAKATNLDLLSFSGFTALQLAAMNNHVDCINVLFNMGAAVEKQTAAGQTALHLAAKLGHLQSVQYLVEKCAAVDSEDSDRRRAADLANEHGHMAVEFYLRDRFTN